MNYEALYERFIASRRLLEASVALGEYHHILPRALGGGDSEGNLIKLSYSDHYFAHLLLAKLHKGPMVLAFLIMGRYKKYSGKVARLRYELLRSEVNKILSQKATNRMSCPELRERLSVLAKSRMENPVLLEKVVNALNTPEAHAKSAATQRGKTLSVEHKQRIGRAQTGRSHSAETRARISAGLKAAARRY